MVLNPLDMGGGGTQHDTVPHRRRWRGALRNDIYFEIATFYTRHLQRYMTGREEESTSLSYPVADAVVYHILVPLTPRVRWCRR